MENNFITARNTVMKYWSLPINASTEQKKRFNKELNLKNYIFSIKKDGHFFRLVKDNQGYIELLSRTISTKTNDYVNKIANVPFLQEYAQDLPNNTILLGEIYLKNNSNSTKVQEIMGCESDKAIHRQQEIKDNKLCYYIFDCLYYGGKNLLNETHLYRAEFLTSLTERLTYKNRVLVANFIYDNTFDIITNWLEQGEEGAVLLKLDGKYKDGRSKSWETLKIKQELVQTVDCFIIGYKESDKTCTSKELETWQYWLNKKTGLLNQGNYYGNDNYTPVNQNYFNGFISAFELGLYDKNNNIISIGYVSNITDEVKKEIKSGVDYIGKVIEINAMSFDEQSKRFRHSKIIRYRNDKTKTECKYTDYFTV